MTWNETEQIMLLHLQISKPQRQPLDRFKWMTILEVLISQGMAYKEISRIPRDQKAVNLLSCEWCSSMIIKNIKLFLQNIWKNKFFTNTILESNKKFNIIFIQELPWLFIQSILSSSDKEDKSLVDALNYKHLSFSPVIFSLKRHI